MKQILSFYRLLILAVMLASPGIIYSQTCSLGMSVTTSDSRCKATGSITVTVTGGSGSYNYAVTGSGYNSSTSSNLIDGLKPGVYSIKVKDISSGCTAEQLNITVGGNYQDPRFNLLVTDASCINAANGSITVSNVVYGTGPFQYSIVAPSTYGVGTSNNTGLFNNLPAGNYYVQLADSCGGLQTRVTTIASYDWTLGLAAAARVGCDSADVTISATDNRGNTNNGSPVFSSFTYGATVTPGDTVWSANRSFRFYKGKARSAVLIIKDGCGNIKTLTYRDNYIPNVNASVSISGLVCGGFNATVVGQQNLTNPQYCLYDNSNTLVSCNSSGVFSAIPYGSYCIAITDACYDTTFNRCFTATPPVPNVASNVSISNLVCTGFDVAVTGQQNLTSPQYCLYDSVGTQISCNSTGTFSNLSYGSYCIAVTDGCSGAVINRCFTQRRLTPLVGTNVVYSNFGCSSFTAGISGQSNLTNAQYCIYDQNNNILTCNTTGVFSNLLYGSYCIKIQNDATCFDTTMLRCFTVGAPVPAVGTVNVSNRTCTDFTATVTGQVSLTNPQYCLYDNSNNLVTCNSTGQFNNLAYGSYCIKVQNDGACFDTTFTRCFSATVPVPAVGGSVNITNRACATFSAAVTGQTNLTSPMYYLLDAGNNAIDSNASGVFNNINYGAYCIKLVNACYDTTITRCFSASPNPITVGVTSSASCSLGKTNLVVNVGSGTAPYSISVYNPWGMLTSNTSSMTASTTISGLPGLPAGYNYKVYVTTACGGLDSAVVTPLSYTFTKTINANSKCPGGLWQNGSGDLLVNAQFSGGAVTPAIIKRDGIAINIPFSTQSGSNFTFTNMQPANYIIQYTLQTCGSIVYDTFTLNSYTYPTLDQSAVYQCNNNNFSVSAAASGGIAPFSYEVIGSSPSLPSILQAPQSAPTFSISNGTTYSLVRLRVIDACGNATINDASILPLANTIITASSDCYFNSINLTVDSVANATYAWYKKTSDIDSVLIDNNQTHTIPYLLPSDTGTYVNVMSVNGGCLQKVSSFKVSGLCGKLLEVNGLTLAATEDKDNNQLRWNTARNFDASRFVIEKSTDGLHYQDIGTVNASAANKNAASQYMFSDINVTASRNFYRLRVVKSNNKFYYSNAVELNKKAGVSVNVMPNPVADAFTIKFQLSANSSYDVTLVSTDGRTIIRQQYAVRPGDTKTIQRPANITTGVYYLLVMNTQSKEKTVVKLFFK